MSNARKLADNLPTDGQLGNRNIIINGAMAVAQRGTQSTTTNGFGTVDRFRVFNGSVGTLTTNQHSGTTNAVDGVSNYSFRATGTNTASLAANSDAHIRYVVEDKDIINLGITNPNNKFTLSFHVKCSVAGQSSIGITTGDFSTARYVVPYTIAAADTWQKVVITFPGHASAYSPTSGFGLRFYWDLGLGTNYQTSTYNQWITSGSHFGATGNIQIVGVYDRWLQITGVQLEKGSESTPFEQEPYETSLRKCQRYFYTVKGSPNGKHVGSVVMRDNTYFYGYPRSFPTPMRAAPTFTYSGPRVYVGDHTNGFATLTLAAAETDAFSFNGSAAGAVTAAEAGHTGLLYMDATSSNHVTFDAEL